MIQLQLQPAAALTLAAQRSERRLERGVGQGATKLRSRLGRLARTVFVARPEESAQPVAAPSRHDVDMEMGDALTDHIVVRDKGALCTERIRHHGSDVPHTQRKRADSLEG
jgi:hypothetical protein